MSRTLLCASMLMLGCSNSSSTPAADLAQSSVPDLAQLADLTSAYPPGPYGNTVGAVFPPLTWEGYFDPLGDSVATMKTFGSYTMDNVRTSGHAYAMIHVSDFF